MSALLMAAALVLGVVHAGENTADDTPRLRVLSWGGAYEAAQTQALFEPFTEATGIPVSVDAYAGGLQALREATHGDGPPWDVIDMTMSDARAACAQGLLQSLDAQLLDPAPDGTAPRQDFFEGAFTECAIAHTVFATVVAYDRTAFPGNRPTSIKHLFDIEGFPGPRALQRTPAANLEWALLSYNVPLEELYGLLSTERGLSLALRRLDSLGEAIHWWEGAEEPVQLLADGEVVMASGFNGRFFDAIVNQGAPIDILWDGQIQEFETWVIPNGADNPHLAREFIRFATRTDRLVEFARHLPYGPVRRSAAEQVTTHKPTGIDMRLHVPTHPLNAHRAVRKDETWYAQVHARINERFRDWLEGRGETNDGG
ncbi:extracellular solute-binding protein [Aquisalimonas sp.]|uniref:extracellular solute-binding protein n=1 Tax=Aquisalimonas sp. TaxID=1872621 RepID=UPI0025BC45AB|nr:extracellular solute-binding protein [Aquisalimonas sp.]